MKYSKTIKSVLRGGLFLLTLLCQNTALAQDHDLPPMDSVEISLLTCQPHDEVYSLYGHTAIRYHEFTKGGIDAAFNYGVFNYDAPFFVEPREYEPSLPGVDTAVGDRVAFGDESQDTEDVFRRADAALYEVKAAGGHDCRIGD